MVNMGCAVHSENASQTRWAKRKGCGFVGKTMPAEFREDEKTHLLFPLNCYVTSSFIQLKLQNLTSYIWMTMLKTVCYSRYQLYMFLHSHKTYKLLL